MSIGRACVQIPILHKDTHTLTVESVEISVLDTGATRFGGKLLLTNSIYLLKKRVLVGQTKTMKL